MAFLSHQQPTFSHTLRLNWAEVTESLYLSISLWITVSGEMSMNGNDREGERRENVERPKQEFCMGEAVWTVNILPDVGQTQMISSNGVCKCSVSELSHTICVSEVKALLQKNVFLRFHIKYRRFITLSFTHSRTFCLTIKQHWLAIRRNSRLSVEGHLSHSCLIGLSLW